MGLANVNRSTCVAWNGGRDCIVCAEVCPYSAVIFKDTFDDTLPIDANIPITGKTLDGKPNKGRIKRVPTVDEKLCTGCGLCEYHCPVLPDHSIVVYTFAEDRGEKDDPKDPARFIEPHENPLDGFWRGGWEKNKEAGKDAYYATTAEDFEKYKAISGPQGAASPQGSYNPNPTP